MFRRLILAVLLLASVVGVALAQQTYPPRNRFDRISLRAVAFASAPACGASTEGTMMAITDATLATWGSTIVGGSTNHVLGYCDGTNWTIAGK